MRVSDAGRAKIIEREGVRLKPYADTKGLWTIGMGNRFYPDGRPVKQGDPPITRAQADEMFRVTLDQFASGVERALTRTPSQAQFDAMVSFAYNIGLGGFQRSSVLMKFNAGDIQGAAKAFDLYHIPPEIVGRRNGERMQFLNGSDVSRPATPPAPPTPAPNPWVALWNFIMAIFRRKS